MRLCFNRTEKTEKEEIKKPAFSRGSWPMYHQHLYCQHGVLSNFFQTQMTENIREMAPTLDHRFYSSISHPSISPSSVASPLHPYDATPSSPMGVPSPVRTPVAHTAKRESTASSPSLRSKEGVLKSTAPPPAFSIPSASSNSNVKVVVRVRGFLPRG